MGELLDGFVPGLPEALREQILARAEGVPLYAVETVRMLLDRGLLVQEGAIYRPTGEIPSLEVPETLQGLVASRLDGLPDPERRLLQDGAVIGKTFTRQALAAVARSPETELETLLTSLVRKEILGVQADPTSPEHGQSASCWAGPPRRVRDALQTRAPGQAPRSGRLPVHRLRRGPGRGGRGDRCALSFRRRGGLGRRGRCRDPRQGTGDARTSGRAR